MASKSQPLDMFWFIPVSGDGHYLGTKKGNRPPDFKYLKQIAQAVDQLGFGGVLLPTGKNCDDPLTVATALATHTEKLRFLVALRPSIASVTFHARQFTALDRLSNGRALCNIVSGGNPTELASDGVFLDHDERYAHTAEFLTVFRALLNGEKTTFNGKHIHVENAQLGFRPVQTPFPIWFGGSSEAAQDVAAEHVDTYLTWAEPVQDVAAKIKSVRARARAKGRRVKFGMRVHFVVRETEAEAWAAADRLIADLTDEAIEAAQTKFTKESDSIGQQRMSQLHRSGHRDNLLVGPNLWAGVGLVRGGAGTALVGDPKQVAERLREYQAVGVERIIGSGYPHLEEAYRVGELLLPELGIGKVAPADDSVVHAEFGTSGTGVRIAAAS